MSPSWGKLSRSGRRITSAHIKVSTPGSASAGSVLKRSSRKCRKRGLGDDNVISPKYDLFFYLCGEQKKAHAKKRKDNMLM